MKILILENDSYMSESKDSPVIGKRYLLEDAVNGTNAQNRAFHPLLQEYYKSGMHSYNADNFADFKNKIKRHLGVGFESFVYAEMKGYQGDMIPVIKDAKKYEDIPEYIRKDVHMKEMIRGRLKSWSDYTKKERMKTMDLLIAEMTEVGVNTKKFDDILEGMKDEAKGN